MNIDTYPSGRLPIIHRHIGALTEYGVISQDQADQIDTHLQESDRARTTAHNAEQHVRALGEALGAKLDGSPDHIVKAAATMPSVEQIVSVARGVNHHHAQEAWNKFTSNLPGIVNALNETANTIHDTATELIDLRTIQNADEAIAAGKAGDWMTLRELMEHHKQLLQDIHSLRQDKLIPGPKMDSHTGPWWTWRHPANPAKTRNDVTKFWHSVIDRQIYVPANQEEAEAIHANNYAKAETNV